MAIPVVDLSPFLLETGNVEGKKSAIEIISQASSTNGFFHVINHGVPLNLISQAMGLSKTFFDYPEQEKLKCSTVPGSAFPTGYSKRPGKKEDMFMCAPGSSLNVFPSDPPQYQKVMEELFSHLVEASRLLESIMNEVLDLPPNFLQQYNNDPNLGFMIAFRYFQSKEVNNLGGREHQDSTIFTLVIQDLVGGLQFRGSNGEMIPVTPVQGALFVNVGDVTQVLTNNKFKSSVHSVLNPQTANRHSLVFHRVVDRNQWLEPLPQCTTQAGELPYYRGFFFKDLNDLKVRTKNDLISRPEDIVGVDQFAIPNNHK